LGAAQQQLARGDDQGGAGGAVRGRPVQVDPIKPTLKATKAKCLKPKTYELLSSFDFKFNLRRYNVELGERLVAVQWPRAPRAP